MHVIIDYLVPNRQCYLVPNNYLWWMWCPRVPIMLVVAKRFQR